MPYGVNCILTEQEVQEAFLAAPTLISQQILDLTIKTPSFLRDLPALEEFPLGNGTQMQQLITRGTMPAIERGFNAWKKLDNNTGCDPCDGPDCAYNWTQFGGLGIESKVISLMERDFRSQSYCIKKIQTTAHFQQIFGQIVKNLFAQIAFFKEQNISFNYLTSLAKKYVVDSGGPKPNPENPYVYRNKGAGVVLSALNIDLLEFFYEYMRRDPSAVPFDVVNGAPIFSLMASPQTLQRLYRDDPQLRQDVRFSGLANEQLMKYNFMSTIRGMFIAAPIMYPRRFNWDDTAGWTEILPFVNGVPMQVGSFTGFNPDYEDPSIAQYEEVLLHGRSPFKILFMPTAQSLGANTSFGPEFAFMNSWMWVNTFTDPDPFRRVGYFATSATIGLAPEYSEALYGILVKRADVGLTFAQSPIPVCPTEPPDCDNTVPDVGCPCPQILTSTINPINGNVVLTLAAPLVPVPVAEDTIQFGIDTGGYLTGTVVDANEDGDAVEVTFADVDDLGVCDHFTTIFCDNTLGCSATVQSQCTEGTTSLRVVLSNPIKAVDNNDVVTVTYADGTTEDVDVAGTPNLATLEWVLDGFTTSFTPGTCGIPTIVSVCVPPATDATCPACGGPTYTQCET